MRDQIKDRLMMKNRREMVGQVISHKMEKTVVVKINRTVRHSMYGKVIRQQTKLKAHDAKNECQVGDKVRLVESRPLSKEKHWRVMEVLARAKVVEPVVDERIS